MALCIVPRIYCGPYQYSAPKIDVLNFSKELKYLVFVTSRWCIVHDICHELLFHMTQRYSYNL